MGHCWSVLQLVVTMWLHEYDWIRWLGCFRVAFRLIISGVFLPFSRHTLKLNTSVTYSYQAGLARMGCTTHVTRTLRSRGRTYSGRYNLDQRTTTTTSAIGVLRTTTPWVLETLTVATAAVSRVVRGLGRQTRWVGLAVCVGSARSRFFSLFGGLGWIWLGWRETSTIYVRWLHKIIIKFFICLTALASDGSYTM